VRNILAGMLRAAPDVARLADLAQAGARQDADIAGPLVEAVRLLSGVEGIGHVTFREGDVVRHDLVRKIVKAYEDAAREAVVAPSPDRGAPR
jgi:hypothetical protein